ncbi:MAG: TonB-dependent receptor [Gemmatimonadota bacterium]|nr:TonB-dependent receptor [Gemmatimonadota bacterium]
MKRYTVFALTIASLLGAITLSAQGPGGAPSNQPLPVGIGEVSGKVVVTGTTTPIPHASVAVRARGTNVLATGAIVDDNGSFRLQGLRPGTYYIRVTSIGFTPKNFDFTITAAAPTVALGALSLPQVAVELQTVAVTTDRATMAVQPDRNAYTAKQVAPTATNASEVLDAVPSVQVDGDGKVSFRGNENVVIQINGRPTPITGAQLAGYLKSLPANIVDKVEVVPNPSAKYDPEGMAGIINIVLKQNVDLGMSGGLVMGGAAYDRTNASGNIGYQEGALTLFNSAGFNNDGRTILGVDNRERLSSGAAQSYTNQTISNPTTNRGQNWTSNVDYKVNKRDVVSNQFSANHRTGDDASLINYDELNSAGSLFSRYARNRSHGASGWVADNAVLWKRTIEPRKNELSTELRFNHTQDTDQTLIWLQPMSLGGTSTGGQIQGENDDTRSRTSQLTGQLDYTKVFGTGAKLESGFKGYGRWLHRDFLVQKDANGSGTWVRSNLSNTFAFDENVQAVYGVVSKSKGKFDLQGGLRGEWAKRDFSLATPAASYPHSYGSLFPSGVVNYNLSQATQMKLSYSRRIRRPGTQELNPFPTFFDVQNVFIGNPKLNPEYTDAVEAGWSHTGERGTLQFSPFYRHTSNIIRVAINANDTIDSRPVTTISFQNLKNSNSFGTDLNGTVKVGKKFNGLASFNIYKMVTDGGSASSAVGSNAVMWSSRVNGTMQFTPATTVQASYFYRGPQTFERGKFWAQQAGNLSVRQKFNDASTVSLRIQDPFNTMKFKVKVGDEKTVQFTQRSFDSRSVYLTYQYNFGRPPRFRVPKQDAPQDSNTGFPPPQ